MGSEKLKKKVALITGGASGIGLGIAEKFVKEGANVVLADLDEGNMKASKARIGDACAGITTNVTMEEDMKKAVDFAVDTFGSLDIGVNAAGAGTFANITDLSYEEFSGIVDLCLKGVFLAMKYEAKQMIAQGTQGSIINISSLNSIQPAKGYSAYCSSKAAVNMLTEVGAMELGPCGIRVNAIAPGLILTPQTVPIFDMEPLYEDYLDNTPLGRSGTTDDVSNAALVLASNDSAWISGDTLRVDGGSHTGRYPDMAKNLKKMGLM